MLGNNFFFNGSSDPLLNQSSYNMEERYQEIERMQAALEQKKQAMQRAKNQMVQQPQQSQTPIWDEIESIVSAMTDKEFEIVTNNEEFIESQNMIMSILQAKYMQMMRPVVEGSKEGKDALENHLTLVKRLRKSAATEVDKEINDFQEYKEKYSDIPYSEYQKMKRQKGGKK
jgi:hypothetical protein